MSISGIVLALRAAHSLAELGIVLGADAPAHSLKRSPLGRGICSVAKAPSYIPVSSPEGPLQRVGDGSRAALPLGTFCIQAPLGKLAFQMAPVRK